jgi:hypothetical protein
MKDFKVGQKVKVEGYQRFGKIVKLDAHGNPDLVQIGEDIIKITSEVVSILGLLKTLFIIISKLFKK